MKLVLVITILGAALLQMGCTTMMYATLGVAAVAEEKFGSREPNCIGDPRSDYMLNRLSCLPREYAKKSPMTVNNVNEKVTNNRGVTFACPLMAAASWHKKPWLERFKELASKGADPSMCRGYPNRFFYEITKSCDGANPELVLGFLESFFELGIELTAPQDILHPAVQSNCKELVEVSLANGADPSLPDSRYLLPLHKSSSGISKYTSREIVDRRIAITRMLVSAGADPHQSVEGSAFPYDDRASPYEAFVRKHRYRLYKLKRPESIEMLEALSGR